MLLLFQKFEKLATLLANFDKNLRLNDFGFQNGANACIVWNVGVRGGEPAPRGGREEPVAPHEARDAELRVRRHQRRQQPLPGRRHMEFYLWWIS